MSASRVRLGRLAALLALASGCVEDVWLGPEQRPDAAPFSPPDSGGETQVDAGTDAALSEPPDASSGQGDSGGGDVDAGPSVELREYCGSEDCTNPALATEVCDSTRVCWPSAKANACDFTCEPGPRCGRPDDEPCPADTFCLFTLPGARCGAGTAGGFCAPYPSSCARSAKGEACGCDGVTYASECDAARIGGVSVAHRGACGDTAIIGTESGDAGAGDDASSPGSGGIVPSGGFAGN